ncbi:hypothetical protein GCM10009119_04210 [Algoriphagus jejuensis]|uniref:histidine kinase n=2 Tax=Algoriphagus jejuensis TaxID=419934 RepID=A0ABN1MW93_9BACT
MPITDFNYELFFDLSPDLFCIAGYDGFFKRINPAVSETLGYTIDELYSRPINDFIHPEDRDITDQVRERLHLSKPLLNFENRYLSKSGEEIWLSWTSMPFESDGMVFAIAKNITHKKNIEADRNALLGHLSQLNQELRQLTYSTSHDLRAPVNNMLAVFELITPAMMPDSEARELMDILKVSGEKLSKTLNHYVDMLKARHSSRATGEKIKLSDCVDAVMDSIRILITGAEAEIRLDFEQVNELDCNRAYMESILLNLITNSIKYAQPGVVPRIRISTRKNQRSTQLMIEDNGLGFDLEKVRPRMFRINQTFHNNQDSKGLGLYLVNYHVTSMGGKIDVESQPNVGTKFTITF